MSMTKAQKFLTLDPDTLPADQLAEVAEHILCDVVPCEFCESWVPRRDEHGYYEIGGVEVCDACESKFQQSKRPLPDVGKRSPKII